MVRPSRGRITSSSFYDVLVCRKLASSDALVKHFMGYTNSTPTSSMQWGIEHEHVVVQEYVCKTCLMVKKASVANLLF